MATYRHIAHGFDPVFDAHSRILILGSFPSELSRANDFYYGNPRNRFWRIIAHCAGARTPEAIEDKRRMLLDHGIALWDAIAECDIKGSSDASIKNVVPTAVERIIDRAQIETVICNGSVAARLYRKYLLYKVGIEPLCLPSTSPANAAWSEERLLAAWSEALGALPLVAREDERDRPHLDEDREPRAKAHPDRHDRGSVEYAHVTLSAPPASSYAVHRSMKGNKRKDTKPELLVRKRLREAGLTGYRLQWKVPGRPDIAWPGKRTAIFVNGCYWHRCPHCNPSTPKRNIEYWSAKFERNQKRDARNLRALEELGWRVHVIWECELKKDAVEDTMARLLPQLAEELGKPLQSA